MDNSQVVNSCKHHKINDLDYCLFIENPWKVCETIVDMLQKLVKLNQYLILKL